MEKEIVLTFNPSLYLRVSDPKLSLNNSIVMRVLTQDDTIEQLVVFDNSELNLPKQTVVYLLNRFDQELVSPYFR